MSGHIRLSDRQRLQYLPAMLARQTPTWPRRRAETRQSCTSFSFNVVGELLSSKPGPNSDYALRQQRWPFYKSAFGPPAAKCVLEFCITKFCTGHPDLPISLSVCDTRVGDISELFTVFPLRKRYALCNNE